MKIKNPGTINEVLRLIAIVRLELPANGFWDGGPKSRFEFEPSLQDGSNIRWSSWEANLFFTIPFKNWKQHISALKRKLQGRVKRTITIEERKP